MPSQLLTSGAHVGRYEVLAHLATGGMAEVYRARDVELGREVALKVLPGRLADNPIAIERFRREARAAARLSHKHIVTLYDFGQAGDTWFLAMEFVDGIDLHNHITANGRLDSEEARLIVIQAVKALDHAFRQGITHRDIKPSNLLLIWEGRKLRVKLTDFGLARAVGDDEAARVTRDGTTVGTVDYLAPEQARDSAQADIRSDIYALGCTLYHMLAGHPPFPGGGLGERIFKHMRSEPPDVRDLNPEVPARLWSILKRMLAKRPDERYQTPAELLDALMRLGGHHRAPPEPAPLLVVSQPSPPPTETPDPDVPPARPARRPRSAEPPPPTQVQELTAAALLGVSAEQRRVAAGQFERAGEVLSSDNQEKEYAYKLLLSCCALDPANLTYRKKLRQVGREVFPRQGLAKWLAAVAGLPARTRTRAARHTGDYRKVLAHGEEVLARSPEDTATHLAMAEAAAALQLRDLEVWLLEQACEEVPENVEPVRRLARARERQDEFAKAVALWERVRQLDPQDADAARKINALSARETMARASYRQ